MSTCTAGPINGPNSSAHSIGADGYVACERFAANRHEVTTRNAMLCWAQAQPYVEYTADSEPAAMTEVLDMIVPLFRIKADIRGKILDGQQAKLDYRSHHSVAVVESCFGWVHQQCRRLELILSAP